MTTVSLDKPKPRFTCDRLKTRRELWAVSVHYTNCIRTTSAFASQKEAQEWAEWHQRSPTSDAPPPALSAETRAYREGVAGNPTLRDKFAMQVMQGLLAADTSFHLTAERVAELAYAQADAMLLEREL